MNPLNMSVHLVSIFERHGTVVTFIQLASMFVFFVAVEIILGLEKPSAPILSAEEGSQNVSLPMTPHEGVVNSDMSTDAAGELVRNCIAESLVFGECAGLEILVTACTFNHFVLFMMTVQFYFIFTRKATAITLEVVSLCVTIFFTTLRTRRGNWMNIILGG